MHTTATTRGRISPDGVHALQAWKPLILGMVIAALCGAALWGWTPTDVSNPGCRSSGNAAWISVDWTSQPVDEIAVQRLVASAVRRKIRYLFPYVSYLKADGTFSLSHDHAPEFVDAVRKQDDEIAVLAWIGLPLQSRGMGIQGWVDLSQPATRRKIVDYAGIIVQRAGFDGIHINAETVLNDSPGFLLLLEELRARLGAEKIISVAGSHWVSDFANALPPIRDLLWTDTYYQAVGARVNQIATMTYDSHMPLGELYRLWMREQVKAITRSLAHSSAELLVGISVSRESTPSHVPAVENLENGLAGMCAGVSGSTSVRGAAVYADWEFTQADEEVWRRWQR